MEDKNKSQEIIHKHRFEIGGNLTYFLVVLVIASALLIGAYFKLL